MARAEPYLTTMQDSSPSSMPHEPRHHQWSGLFAVLLLALALGTGVPSSHAGEPETPAEKTAVEKTAADKTAAEKVERLAIIERAIEYHGGDLYQHSTTHFELCSKSGCFDVTTTVDGDGYVYDVSGRAREGLRRVRATNGGVERWRDGEPVPVEEDQIQGLRDWVMARVYFAFLPYRLDDPKVFKQDLGIERWQDRSLHKVKVTFAPGSSTDAADEFMYWLDPETGRLELLAYNYWTNGGGLRFRRAVDHRRVGGLLFFDQENYGLDGMENGAPPSVDSITPRRVAEEMRHISTVRLENLRAEPLPSSSPPP